MTSDPKKEKPTVLVVHPQPGRTDEWSGAMPRYEWVDAPQQWPQQPGDLRMNRSPDAIVVDAEEESDEDILETCEALSRLEPVRETPVLVALSMYRMHLGNRVRKFPYTNILIYPVEEADIQKQLSDAAHSV